MAYDIKREDVLDRLRLPVEGERVRVYFNLHKSCWSIMAKSGEHRGRVIAHANELWLKKCSFYVSQAGRNRVLREGRKNVHAFIEGEFSMKGVEPGCDVPPISYNPFKADYFHIDGLPMGSAEAVFFDSDRKVYNVASFTCDIENLFD